jgi:hypothetical protein
MAGQEGWLDVIGRPAGSGALPGVLPLPPPKYAFFY